MLFNRLANNAQNQLDPSRYIGDTIKTELPTNLKELLHIQAMNRIKDDPNLTPEENKRRKENIIKFEQAIRAKKEHFKSIKQKSKDKIRSKLAAKSKRRNRN